MFGPSGVQLDINVNALPERHITKSTLSHRKYLVLVQIVFSYCINVKLDSFDPYWDNWFCSKKSW
jgi:hypothetical protein